MRYDAVVIGSGLSGNLVAQTLSERGWSVLVLEVERKPGGRTLEWGGWCTPAIEQNLKDARAWGHRWPLRFDELSYWTRRAMPRLGVRPVSVPRIFSDATRKIGLPLVPKLAATCADGSLLTGASLRGRFERKLQAAAFEIQWHPKRGRASAVKYRNQRSGKIEAVVASRAIICCASPFETARLLVNSSDLRARLPLENLGRQLTHHFMQSWIIISPMQKRSESPPPGTALVPRFVNLGRKGPRDYESGFVIEVAGPLPVTADIARDLALSAKERRHSVYFALHALGETPPARRRRLKLQVDARGRWEPVVSWAWTMNERRMARDMREACLALGSALTGGGGVAHPLQTRFSLNDLAHEASTAPMGRSAASAFTAPNGEVWGVPGLYVADASLLPTGLDRHPTLTIAALALRVAETLTQP